jgi:hypothetical protein
LTVLELAARGAEQRPRLAEDEDEDEEDGDDDEQAAEADDADREAVDQLHAPQTAGLGLDALSDVDRRGGRR